MRKNFAFIYYASHEAAVKAIEEMNGFTLFPSIGLLAMEINFTS